MIRIAVCGINISKVPQWSSMNVIRIAVCGINISFKDETKNAAYLDGRRRWHS